MEENERFPSSSASAEEKFEDIEGRSEDVLEENARAADDATATSRTDSFTDAETVSNTETEVALFEEFINENEEFTAPELAENEIYSEKTEADNSIKDEIKDEVEYDDRSSEDKTDTVEQVRQDALTEDKDSNEEDEKKDPSARAIHTVFDFIELFIFSLVAVLVATTFLFKHSIVEGGSMENTLHENEHIIISDLFYTPKRGDIVVCESEVLDKPVVKRVIAVAGDHVQVTVDGKVTLNGEPLKEPYVFTDGLTFKPEVDIIVGEGEIFVMGDHRNKSTDSREFGTVDTDCVLGKLLIRFYPFEKFGTVE